MKPKKSLLAILLLVFPFVAQAQCAMCRAVLLSSGNEAQAQGINEGIMYLMVFPYILLGGIGFYLWWSLKKQSKRKETNA